MSKGIGAETFRKQIYQGMTQNGYQQPFETFVERNSNPEEAGRLHGLLLRKGLYDGSLDQFKEQFFGVKKKEPTSETSASGSEKSYVGTANVVADGSTLEKKLNSFNIVREGQEFSQGKKETTLAQIKQMRQERPDATIVQVKDDAGKPTLRYLDEHKNIIKKKANRVPDAATLEAKPVGEAVLDYYSNKKDYVDMVEERRARGFATQFSEGKFVAEGINEMQRDVRNAIDLKVKEIGKPILDQYLNLNESLKKTDPNSPEYGKMMADYQKFQQAHPDLQEYEGLVNRFWALDAKNKEARKNPNYKGYYDVQAKKEQAQINADLMDAKAKQGIGKYLDFNAAPAATKELFDLGTGVVRAAAGIERFITGKKYASLDFAVEAMEAVIDPALNSFTATPSNRTKLVGQQYAEVGDYKVLLEGDKVMGVVSKQGGYQLRDQEKAQEIVAQYERDKPKIKTQGINPFTATDVIVGGAMQLATGLGAASVGAKLGKVGSIASSVGSKTASIAANAAGTYNKLYNAAIQELGPSNQKAAERYAALSSLAMSTMGTLINPLEQQLLNVGTRQAVKTLAKELGEGVAEQTAVRSAVRSLMTFAKTAFKEGAVEGAVEAVVDDAIKYGVNKAMLGEDKMEINLSQDLLDNVAEETIGGLFGSVAASLNPSTFQVESLENAYKSPNRAKVLSKLDKDAKKHYEKVFAQADLNPGKSLLKIHQEELIKAKTGEEFVAPPAPEVKQEPEVKQPTPEPTTTALKLAATLDPQQGDKITTPMGQSGTIVGFDIDEEDETPRYYKVKMDESGEETLISIADYNRNIYERGIQDLQSQGMSRNEAEFAVEAARSVKDLSPDVGKMVDQVPDVGNMIEEDMSQSISEPDPTQTPTIEPISEPSTPLYTPSQLEGKKVNIDGEIGFIEKVDNKFYLNNGEELLSIDDDQIEADIIEESPKGIRPNANRLGGQFSFKGDTGTLGKEGDVFTLSNEGKIIELQPDAVLTPVNEKYTIDIRDNDNATVNGVDYRIVTNEAGNVVGLSPSNNPKQVITNERMAVAVEIKRNATVFNEDKNVTPEQYQEEKRQNPGLQIIENILTVGMTEEISQSIDKLYNEEPLSDDEALNLDYWIDGRVKALNKVESPEAKQATQNLNTLKSTIYATTSTDGSRTGSKGKKKVESRKKQQSAQPISEPVFDEPYKNKPRKDGKKFYRLEDGKIEVVEKKDGSAYVSVIGEKSPDLSGTGGTFPVEIEEFDNVEDAKKFAIEAYNQRIEKAKNTSTDQATEIKSTTPVKDEWNKRVDSINPDEAFTDVKDLKVGDVVITKQGTLGFVKKVNPKKVIIETTWGGFGDNDSELMELTVDKADIRQFKKPKTTSETLEERVTLDDIELARNLLGQAKDTLRGALQETGAKVTKALKKYGDVKVVIHDTNAEISAEYNKLAKNKSNVTGFYDPKSKTIHVSLESGNPTHTLLHEALHVFIKGLDTDSFNKLFDELVSIPEYTQALKTKGRSPKEHAAMYPERKQKEEALVEYFSAIASGEIEVKKDSKVIEILNRLLKLLGLKGAIDNANIRIVAQGLATALREGITLEGGPNESDEVEAEVLVDFPYYDKVTKLVENGINKGLTKDQIVQTILSAYNSQNISVPQSLIESIYTSRTAIRKKGRKPVGKLRTAFSNFHQKYFVANGGGEIREMVERLEGTIQRHVDQANELIKLAEKQSKGIDQGLVDRYLRDENSLAEKQEIVATILRPNNVSEELIEKYLRGGTTRYQRLEAVKELDPNVDWKPFVESRMNDQDKALIPVNLAATLSTMRQSLDNLSSYLVDEGYVVGDRTEVILENLGQYMSDVYGIFKDKKFKPTEAAKVKARKYFMEQIRKDANKLAALSATGNDLEEEIFKEAERMVNDYITKSKQPKGQGQGTPVAKKSESIFKQKEGVPDELKELLGKYGPLQEYAYTLFNLVNYVEKSKFQRRMVDLGKGVFMWDRNDPARPADANYELKGFASDKLKGDTNPFKGMMTDQATFEVLAGLDKLFFEGGPILEKFLKFQGFVNKFKTVYSYQTHFGNVLGNFFFMAFNGMVDASTAASFNMARKATGRDLFGGYGLKNDEVDEVLTILKNEQVIGQDVSLMAIRETVGDLEKTKKPSLNPFTRGLQKVRDAAVSFDKGLTNVYQSEDNFFKVLAYMTERKRYSQALYGKSYNQLDSIQKEEVNRIATEIAKANWPNYGRMGKFSQMAAKNNVLFGNFLSFTFEAIRTYGNTWAQATRELKSDNPGVRFIGQKRRAGLLIGSLAADAALMTMAKTASGVFALLFAGDDKTKMNRDLRLGVPKFIQGGDLMFTDKGNGQYSVIDISAKNPLGVFRRHFNSAFFAPTDQEIATAVSKQFLESFLSQSIAVKYTQAIMKNKDDNDKEIYLKTDTGPEAAEKIFMFTLKSIGPAAINSALKVGKSDKPGVTLLTQISGHNVYELDFNNTWGKLTSDYADNLSELRKELRKVANDEDATDAEFKAALKKYNQKRKKELDRLVKLKGSMLNVGVKEAGIEAGIENLTKIDRAYLKTGRFSDKNYSRQELKYD